MFPPPNNTHNALQSVSPRLQQPHSGGRPAIGQFPPLNNINYRIHAASVRLAHATSDQLATAVQLATALTYVPTTNTTNSPTTANSTKNPRKRPRILAAKLSSNSTTKRAVRHRRSNEELIDKALHDGPKACVVEYMERPLPDQLNKFLNKPREEHSGRFCDQLPDPIDPDNHYAPAFQTIGSNSTNSAATDVGMLRQVNRINEDTLPKLVKVSATLKLIQVSNKHDERAFDSPAKHRTRSEGFAAWNHIVYGSPGNQKTLIYLFKEFDLSCLAIQNAIWRLNLSHGSLAHLLAMAFRYARLHKQLPPAVTDRAGCVFGVLGASSAQPCESGSEFFSNKRKIVADMQDNDDYIQYTWRNLEGKAKQQGLPQFRFIVDGDQEGSILVEQGTTIEQFRQMLIKMLEELEYDGNCSSHASDFLSHLRSRTTGVSLFRCGRPWRMEFEDNSFLEKG